MIQIALLPSAARSATFNSETIQNLGHHPSITLYLDITAVTGTTPTADIKLQAYDKLSAKWFDIASGAFAQKTATGQSTLTLAAGLPDTWRVLATLGGTSPVFTFSLGGCLSD